MADFGKEAIIVGMIGHRSRVIFDKQQGTAGQCRRDGVVRHAPATIRRCDLRDISRDEEEHRPRRQACVRFRGCLGEKSATVVTEKLNAHDWTIVARCRHAGGSRSSNLDDAILKGIRRAPHSRGG